MAVVQLAGELQAPVDPHADRLAEEFFGSNGKPELASLLARVADLVEPALDPLRRCGPSVSLLGSLPWACRRCRGVASEASRRDRRARRAPPGSPCD
jgi:hypothetical protein